MILGITGGVGAGKSSVLAILEKEYNAKLILADEVGRELMQPGDRKSTRLNSSHPSRSRMPSSA